MFNFIANNLILSLKSIVALSLSSDSLDQITFAGAFLGGITSFFSPCIIPVLPMYFGFMSGDLDLKNKKNLYINSISFLTGLSFVNLLLGASAGALGSFFIENGRLITKITAVVIIVMGLFQLGIIKPSFLMKERKMRLNLKGHKFIASFFLGIGFSFGWTPCTSAVLTPILALVANNGSIVNGVIALAIYSIGFMIPFLISTLFIEKLSNLDSHSGKWMKGIKFFMGVVMLVMGILLFTNKLYVFMNLI